MTRLVRQLKQARQSGTLETRPSLSAGELDFLKKVVDLLQHESFVLENDRLIKRQERCSCKAASEDFRFVRQHSCE